MQRFRPARRSAGFTLVEILVVVVIMAVLTTVAMLSMGLLGEDRGLETEGDRYADVVAAASEQAGLEGRDYGLWIGPDRYEVLTYVARRQRWETLPEDRLYEAHELPAGVAPQLEIEGRLVLLGRDKPDTPRVPQILLYASGDSSAYRLELIRDGSNATLVVEGPADGTLSVTPPGKTP
ncbi:MAG: prepilin-type N-terminal cleavage/methylation domain-containing protein [Proteobacteria bacterium]|nr:prepilin-type N-terminal cleavage/methylation domain-containing protein [Pseudomonadota bacterium]